jgi:ppGpp synthetase/RelA/SpoT-type nucleotidyltranferase
MSYPTEHTARIAASGRFKDLRRKNDEFGEGIDVVYGITGRKGPRGGRTKVQSIRFDSKQWTVGGAEDWIDENGFDPIDFEPAAADRSNPSGRSQRVLDALNRQADILRDEDIRENPAAFLDESDYPGIFSDFDGDAIPTADDPHPLTPGDTETIEEVRLSDELGKLFQVRDEFDAATQEARRRLARIGEGTVKSRTKTPYSIINKLRRKRLEGPKGITDISGVMLVTADYETLKEAAAKIRTSAMGEVLEEENHYELPGGYKALHFIVRVNGRPVEVQLKTSRQACISSAAHTPYKNGTIDLDAMEELTDLAHAADRGDTNAQEEIDPYILGTDGCDEEQLEAMMTQSRANPSGSDAATWIAGGLLGALGLTALSNMNQQA